MTDLTVIDGERTVTVPAAVEGESVLLNPAAIREATGWELKPEGLCRDDMCVPFRRGTGGETVDLVEVAAALQRPLAADAGEGVVALGEIVSAGLQPGDHAPDFTLPDLDGTPWTLSATHGRKRLLLAWASW